MTTKLITEDDTQIVWGIHRRGEGSTGGVIIPEEPTAQELELAIIEFLEAMELAGIFEEGGFSWQLRVLEENDKHSVERTD